jgi:hypothetical protein
MGAEERFQTLLGGAPIGEAISEIAPGVSAVRLLPEVAFREYGLLVLKSERLTRTLFDNRYVQGFFKGAPGLKEWALLGKAWYHATETLPSGAPRFDVVLFDAPATGHALDMLRVPRVILEVSPPGVLRSDAQRAWAFFRDPAKAGVVVVTLPEELPTNETMELVSAVRGELGLPVVALAVNCVIDQLFEETARAKLANLEVEAPRDPAARALSSAVRRALREKVQSESLARLGALGTAQITLPWVPGGVDAPDALSRLVERF